MPSVYDKIGGVRSAVLHALVAGSVERFVPVMKELEPNRSGSVRELALRIVDGNHLAASEKRLKALRGFRGAALPGQALVVYDPDLELVRNLLLWTER